MRFGAQHQPHAHQMRPLSVGTVRVVRFGSQRRYKIYLLDLTFHLDDFNRNLVASKTWCSKSRTSVTNNIYGSSQNYNVEKKKRK